MSKYYIVHYPSSWGMGSDTDVSLVTEANLRKIIALEIEKLKTGRRYCDRFTGTWNEEKLSESEDIEEIIDDVIKKRLNTCSTYADLPDLIELPDGVPVKVIYEKLEDTIFRACNQWDYITDVIVGEAYITRYRVDLTDYTEDFGLGNGCCYEFVEYDFKRVAENHYSDTVDDLLKIMKKKATRMKRKLKGKPSVDEGKYIDDLLPELGDDDWYRQELRSALATIAKFSNLPDMEDEYIKHIYKEDYGLFSDVFQEQELKDKTIDHTKQAFIYPLLWDNFACQIIGNSEDCRYLAYNELFLKGYDVHYLMADLTRRADSVDDFEEDASMFLAIESVFGYD